MKELLAMAQQISGIEYDIGSYSDIVQAIHVVQQQMGISGTTAAEAADTIQGSTGSMAAAWENLKVELVKDNGDIGNSIDILVNSATTMFDNIEPKIERALGGVGTLVDKAAPILQKKLPEMINKVFPSLLSASGQLLGSVLTGVGNSVPALIDTGVHLLGEVSRAISRADFGGSEILTNIIEKMAEKLPATLRYSRRIVSALSEAIGGIDWGQVAQGASEGFHQAFDFVSQILSIIDWGGIAEDISYFIQNVDWGGIASEMGSALVGAINVSTQFLEKMDWVEVGSKISEFINGVDWGAILESLGELLNTIIAETPNFLKGIFETLDWENAAALGELIFAPKLLGSIKNFLVKEGVFDEINSIMGDKIGAGAEGEGGAAYKFFSRFTTALEAFAVGWEIGTFIRNMFGAEKIDAAVGEVMDNIREAITGHSISDDEAEIDSTETYMQGLEERRKWNAWAKSGNTDWGGDWFIPNARGSIVTRPTRALIGEAGAEAVIPLEHQTQWIDKVAERMNSAGNGGGGATYIFNFEGAYIGSKEMARELVQPMSEELQRLYNRGSRGLGGV